MVEIRLSSAKRGAVAVAVAGVAGVATCAMTKLTLRSHWLLVFRGCWCLLVLADG